MNKQRYTREENDEYQELISKLIDAQEDYENALKNHESIEVVTECRDILLSTLEDFREFYHRIKGVVQTIGTQNKETENII